MKAILFILGVSLACIGVAGVIAYYEPAPDVAQAAPAFTRTVSPAATDEPSATPEPTRTLVPTMNAELTAAAVNLEAASRNLQAAQEGKAGKAIEATALVEAEAIRATSQARADNAKATSQAGDLLIIREQNRADEIALDKMKAENAAENDERNHWLRVALTVSLTVLAFVIVGVVIRSWFRKPSEVEENDELQETEPVRPPDFIAGVRWSLLGVSYSELLLIAAVVAEGRSLSDLQIVRTCHIMPEGQFADFQNAIIDRGLAEWKNADHHKQGVRLTTKGVQFFGEIVGAPTPLPAPLTPIAPILGVEDTIRTPEGFEPVGEGE